MWNCSHRIVPGGVLDLNNIYQRLKCLFAKVSSGINEWSNWLFLFKLFFGGWLNKLTK